MQRSEEDVQQLWGRGVGDVAAQPGLRNGGGAQVSARAVRLASPLPHEGPGGTRSHQQAEGVLDFLKHVCVLGL